MLLIQRPFVPLEIASISSWATARQFKQGEVFLGFSATLWETSTSLKAVAGLLHQMKQVTELYVHRGQWGVLEWDADLEWRLSNLRFKGSSHTRYVNVSKHLPISGPGFPHLSNCSKMSRCPLPCKVGCRKYQIYNMWEVSVNSQMVGQLGLFFLLINENQVFWPVTINYFCTLCHHFRNAVFQRLSCSLAQSQL